MLFSFEFSAVFALYVKKNVKTYLIDWVAWGEQDVPVNFNHYLIIN